MKQAVVFVIDASPSMDTPLAAAAFAATQPPLTRRAAAKQAVTSRISQLMLQSKTNEVSVIVFPTRETSHHKIAAGQDVELDEEEEEEMHRVPFAHVTELTHGVTRPSVELLRQLQHVQQSPGDDGACDKPAADVCDALILAADALYERTQGKKYERKIVVYSDLQHAIVLDVPQLLIFMDSLQAMECVLEVIVINDGDDPDFAAVPSPVKSANVNSAADTRIKTDPDEAVSNATSSIKMEEDEVVPSQVLSNSNNGATVKVEAGRDSDTDSDDDYPVFKKVKQEEPSPVQSRVKHEEDDDENENVDMSNNHVVYASLADRLALMQSLTDKSNGSLVAVTSLEELLTATPPMPSKEPTKFKLDFYIAPGLEFEIRQFKLFAEDKPPSLQLGVVRLEDDRVMDEVNSKILVSDLLEKDGQTLLSNEGPVLDNVKKIYKYIDPERPDDVINVSDTTKAVRYGADLVPMTMEERQALKTVELSKPKLQIIGYMLRDKIPAVYLIGAPHMLIADSLSASAAMAALAVALERKEKVAVCTFYKRKTSDPVLGALFPYASGDEESMQPRHLVFLQLPFAGETKQVTMASFESYLKHDDREKRVAACNSFIDALRLPDPVLKHGTVASPFLQSFHETLVRRALDANSPIVTSRTLDERDPMSTPPAIVSLAEAALADFRTCLPIIRKDKKEEAAKLKENRRGPKTYTYKDFLDK